ncbi:MAG: hypothetical protein AAFN27_24690, partial [Pseudomonadota bacterium]
MTAAVPVAPKIKSTRVTTFTVDTALNTSGGKDAKNLSPDDRITSPCNSFSGAFDFGRHGHRGRH